MKTKLIILLFVNFVFGCGVLTGIWYQKQKQVYGLELIKARERTIMVFGRFNDGAEWQTEIKLIDEIPTYVHAQLLNTIRYKQNEYSSDDYPRFVRDTELRVANVLDVYGIRYEYVIVTKEDIK